jgi:hypothetical protein
MKNKPLIDYSQPSPTKRTDKVLGLLWAVVMTALTVAVVVGLEMRGFWR